jgi:Spy/CpxP family protein refolding chaperone
MEGNIMATALHRAPVSTTLISTSLLLLALFLSTASHAGPGMGYGMMDDEQRAEMMAGGGRYGPRHMPYMGGPGGYGMGNMMGMGPMMMRELYGLQLSDKQRQEIRAILRDLRKKHWQLMEKMMELSEDLSDLFDQRPANPTTIAAAYDKIFAQKKAMIIDMVNVRNKVEALLTDEQRKQLQSNRHNGMGYGMMGNGMGYGGGYGMGYGMGMMP